MIAGQSSVPEYWVDTVSVLHVDLSKTVLTLHINAYVMKTVEGSASIQVSGDSLGCDNIRCCCDEV